MAAPSVKKARPDEHASNRAHPWVEKYRPKRLDDVESQKEAVSALRACLSVGADMPHLLFHGPAGTGKTSSILAVARELFGPDYYKARVRELNASDDRGISVVREKVKKFAQGSATAVRNKVQSDGKVYPVPSFKLIVLDEADALLPDAQAALRRMMEDFCEVTRFCILCNYVSRIIDPIASRCAKFRFKPLLSETLFHRIRYIAGEEQLTISDETLRYLNTAAQGDMRLAITLLQSAARAKGPDLRNEDFVEAAGLVPPAYFTGYLNALCSGNFTAMEKATRDLVMQGYAGTQVVTQLQRWVVARECRLSDAARAALCVKLAETERRLFDRGDDLLQLLDLGLKMVDLTAAAPTTA
jgi:replication factor C subunit 2/4